MNPGLLYFMHSADELLAVLRMSSLDMESKTTSETCSKFLCEHPSECCMMAFYIKNLAFILVCWIMSICKVCASTWTKVVQEKLKLCDMGKRFYTSHTVLNSECLELSNAPISESF